MSAWLWVPVALFALALRSSGRKGESSPEVTPAAKPPRSVVLVGDSYAVGLAPYVRSFAAAEGVGFLSLAVGGTSVCQWALDSWVGPAIATHPDVIVASLGGNDFARTDQDHVRESMLELVRKVRAAGIRFVWIEPCPSKLTDPHELRAAWWTLVGADGFRAASPPEIGADGIHPTTAGFVAWAAELWAWLRRG